jgi:hypothetical protein
MSEPGKNIDGTEMCFEQKQRVKSVEKELHKMANRLERDKIASLFQLQVVAFNCDDKRHTEPNALHFDYIAGGARHEVPGALQAVIKSLEHALAQLKQKVQ